MSDDVKRDDSSGGPIIKTLAEVADEVLEEIKADPKRYQAVERRFRIGAHHATSYLAQALRQVDTVEACRELADAFVAEISRVRPRIQEHFDLAVLLGNAFKKIRS